MRLQTLGALACVAATAWACSDSVHDLCAQAISKQSVCDPSLAGAAPAQISACSQQLESESPSCREASRRLADCLAESACSEANRLCLGSQDEVTFNCSQNPYGD